MRHDADTPNDMREDRSPDARTGDLDRFRSRRLFLVASAALVAGCASRERVSGLPDPLWPAGRPSSQTMPLPPAATPSSAPVANSPFPHVIGRAQWAKGAPVTTLMVPMGGIRAITIHHDGMPPFAATDAASTAARVELIRMSHRNRPQPWGDIGYHFVIDRAGRIYEGRPLQWQGAHVRDHNQGNIGVLCLGNFEVQVPSEQQLNALAGHVRTLRRHYNVPVNRVITHKEWEGARTACPGMRLQPRVESLRSNRAFA